MLEDARIEGAEGILVNVAGDEGMTLTGIPRATISQGHVRWDGEALRVSEGDGRFIERPTFPPVYEAIARAGAASPKPSDSRR